MFEMIDKIGLWYRDASVLQRLLVAPVLAVVILISFIFLLWMVLVLPFKLLGWYGLLVWVVIAIVIGMECARQAAREEEAKKRK